jgi:hypothetical protein
MLVPSSGLKQINSRPSKSIKAIMALDCIKKFWIKYNRKYQFWQKAMIFKDANQTKTDSPARFVSWFI